MKYLKSYKTKEEYVDAIRGGGVKLTAFQMLH